MDQQEEVVDEMEVDPEQSERVTEGIIGNWYWMKHEEQSELILLLPFFVCLAAGNLDPETFLKFVTQDHYFLEAFLQLYGCLL